MNYLHCERERIQRRSPKLLAIPNFSSIKKARQNNLNDSKLYRELTTVKRNGNTFLKQLDEVDQSKITENDDFSLSEISNHETKTFLLNNFGDQIKRCKYGSWNYIPIEEFIEVVIKEFRNLIELAAPIYYEFVARLNSQICQTSSPHYLCLTQLNLQTKKSGMLELIHSVLSALSEDPMFRESLENMEFIKNIQNFQNAKTEIRSERSKLESERHKLEREKENFERERMQNYAMEIDSLDTEEKNTKSHSNKGKMLSLPHPFRKVSQNLYTNPPSSHRNSKSAERNIKMLQKSSSPFQSMCTYTANTNIEIDEIIEENTEITEFYNGFISLFAKMIFCIKEKYSETFSTWDFLDIFDPQFDSILESVVKLVQNGNASALLTKEGAILIDYLQMMLMKKCEKEGGVLKSSRSDYYRELSQNLAVILTSAIEISPESLLTMKITISLSLAILSTATESSIEGLVVGIIGLGKVFDNLEGSTKSHILHYLLDKFGPLIILRAAKTISNSFKKSSLLDTSSSLLILYEILFEFLQFPHLKDIFLEQLSLQGNLTLEILVDAGFSVEFSVDDHGENLEELFKGIMDRVSLKAGVIEKVQRFFETLAK